ncbi:MAG TPA: OFA family MFS transporter [Gemmatimonadaceae bacterium]
MAVLSFLDREHSVAKPGYNRWLVPPAALAIHLSIGQVYAFSVFKIPLSRLIGGSTSAPGDWSLATLAWIFSTAIVFLGLSAAAFGAWLERVGPRRAMFTAALCFGGGFWVASAGVVLHQFWLLILGYGVLGGIGLGIGYISPVSTLIKWFPDRPGMATGMAIMGFGGGAMIASPLSVFLMSYFKTSAPQGVAPTFMTMGTLYFIYMMYGVFTVRVPPADWRPRHAAAAATPRRLVTTADVEVNTAMRTPQFWLLWMVLCLNVTAGIGILEQASPMIQEMFRGRVTPAAAAGFVSLLSLANMGGRFGWSSFSDYIGRKATYFTFFALGAALYASIPRIGASGSVLLFVIVAAILISMYGGGFATIPAYLRDLFGTMQVGAIHGRLLTAWSAAGILGPVLVNYIREEQIASGVPKAHAYDITMYLMAALLIVGFVCNLLVRPVSSRFHYLGAARDTSAGAEVARGAPVTAPKGV